MTTKHLFRWSTALAILLILCTVMPSCAQEQETKEQRDARMGWWREARFGMFIHWGLYAVPAGEWKGQKIPGPGEWIMTNGKIPFEEYQALRQQFNPVKFDAKRWAQLARNAGMKYVVLTTKHIDGFCMFDSKLTDYDIMSTPFKRDVMKELSEAVRAEGMKMCAYYSVSDFAHPDYTLVGPDSPWPNVAARPKKGDMDRYLEYMNGQLCELLSNYGPIGVVWFDACYGQSPEDVHAPELAKMMRSIQPNLIINNRLGYPLDFDTPEQEIPATGIPGRDWETCMTINDTWGFMKNDHNWKSTETLLKNLIDIVSKGGNYLLNVGPTADGEIPPEIVERLEGIGQWMAANGDAIHGTTASCFKRLDWGRCTQKPGKLFLHVFDWPANGDLNVPGLKNKVERAYLLADPEKKSLAVSPTEDGVTVKLPSQAPDKIASVVVLEIQGPANVVADVVRQAPDGSMKLMAVDAVIHGRVAQYSADPAKQSIVCWTDAKDWVGWDSTIKKPGTFDVEITYACQDVNAGSEYVVEVAGQKLTGKVEATGSWTKFVTRKLGNIRIDAGGPQAITVRCAAMPNGVVMDLKAIVLKPGHAETPQQRDARMGWWRDGRFGMFIHWGLYAVPAGEWKGQKIPGLGEWIMYDAKIPVAEYEKFAPQFNPVKFNADQWVGIAKAAGIKYIVITAKHCDGFAMYSSKASKYNIVDATPFKRDPMAELSKACAAQGIRLCFYYSHCWDWHEPNAPGLINDWDFGPLDKRDQDVYFRKKSLPQVEELVAQYKPALLWFDVPDLTPQRSQEFLDVIHRHVPDCIVNDRVGNDLGDYVTPEQSIPANGFPGRDWETCMTINDTWGYKSYDTNFKSTETLLRNLIDIASKGGNYLLNVGPTAEGVIPEPEVQRLEEMGAWLKVNGDAIYGTTASCFKKLGWGRCTQKPGRLFLHVFDWPANGDLNVPGLKNKVEKAYLLADPEKKSLAVSPTEDGVTVKLPSQAPDKIASVVVLEIQGPANVVADVVHQAPDGSVMLASIDAAIHGQTAKYEPEPNRQDIGFWTDAQDWVAWDLSIKKPGQFEVQVTYACPEEHAGSEYVVGLAGQKLPVKVESTGDRWDSFKTTKVGDVQIDAAGRQTLTVRPTAMSNGAVMNLRAILLKPVLAEPHEQRDARMKWWREARFGMFIHWGLYAVPAGEWKGKFVPPGGAEWIMNTANIPIPEYEALAKQFNPTKYDPAAWVRLAKAAGVKYIVITSKHHDGFSIFDTKATDYNVVKTTPYGKDLLKPLADECRKQGLRFCTYYSIMDWHHPAQYRGSPESYNHTKIHPERKVEYIAFMKQQLKELLDGPNPDVLWFDGEWPGWWKEEDAIDISNYLHKLKPAIIINNRLGTGRAGQNMGELGKHDKEYVGDFGTPEQDIPATGLPGVDWETCMTMNDSWGYRTDDTNWKSTEVLVQQLIDSASKGGNYLLNIGPTAAGEIPQASIERLEGIGKWMAVNGEAIYGSTASPLKELSWGRCTQKPGKLFLHVFDWPANGDLNVPGLKNKIKQAYLLADAMNNAKAQMLDVSQSEKGVTIKLPKEAPDAIASVVVLEIEGPANVAP